MLESLLVRRSHIGHIEGDGGFWISVGEPVRLFTTPETGLLSLQLRPWNDVPIIAVSASVLEADQERSRVAGGDAFLPKPISWPKLAVLLEEHLGLMGDMQAIQKRAAHVKTLGEPYVPFARKLRELAKGFEERAILALVEQHMERRR